MGEFVYRWLIGIIPSTLSILAFMWWRKWRERTEQQRLIANALNTEEGNEALRQAMVEPIRRRLDYQGIGRRLLMVDQLPQGALARYERDVASVAQVISQRGGPIDSPERPATVEDIQEILARTRSDPNYVFTSAPHFNLEDFPALQGMMSSGMTMMASGMMGTVSLSGMSGISGPQATLHTVIPEPPLPEWELPHDRWDEI